jgi:hypothetical protein
MIYSNLSNNMMITELWTTINYNSNTVVKQDFAVVKQVDGRAAHITNTTRHQSWQSTPSPPYQIMLDPSLLYITLCTGVATGLELRVILYLYQSSRPTISLFDCSEFYLSLDLHSYKSHSLSLRCVRTAYFQLFVVML